ncbi:MAG: SET domain-containing protein-lysine N-methyltransferase [Verrucomicrobia bacterium]|nr:SET domain-containing protein-lysine N-methyltransferase [Verrucomicrobiota bacterium]
MKPKNWPDKHIYSSESVGVNQHIELLRLAWAADRIEGRAACLEEKRVHKGIEIRRLGKDHPLTGQYGVFAKEKVAAGTFLGEYVGEVYLLNEGQERTFDWVIPCGNGFCWCIDARTVANEMRLVNDYRGLGKEPNAALKRKSHRGFYYAGYETIRDVAAGEEILVDYGPWWESTNQFFRAELPT